MSCCGQKRELLKSAVDADDARVVVEYTGHANVKVSHVPSGTEYRFSPMNGPQPVHREDLPALLRTGAFRLVKTAS